MKKLLSIAMLFFCSVAGAQINKKIDAPKTYGVFQFSSGYFISHYPMVAGQFGLKSHNVYGSFNFIISRPRIVSLNLGYDINIKDQDGNDLVSLQPFISEGYQSIGSEESWRFKGTSDYVVNKFISGYGITFYLRKYPVSFTVEKIGSYVIPSAGIYLTF